MIKTSAIQRSYVIQHVEKNSEVTRAGVQASEIIAKILVQHSEKVIAPPVGD